MAKKQANTNETTAGTAAARAVKTNSPRVKAAQHSKVFSAEAAQASPSLQQTGSEPANSEKARAVIERIAYSYWESRGFQGGSAIEDWVRAENEYRQLAAAARL